MIGSNCPTCPLAADVVCSGRDVRRFCDLANPGHPAFIEGYVGTLRALQLVSPLLEAGDPLVDSAMADAVGCCGEPPPPEGCWVWIPGPPPLQFPPPPWRSPDRDWRPTILAVILMVASAGLLTRIVHVLLAFFLGWPIPVL